MISLIQKWRESIKKKAKKSNGNKASDGKRKYKHFDAPLAADDFKVECAIINPEKHVFFPFILRQQKQRKFRIRSAKPYDKKIRNIMYASHKDAHVYSFYNFILLNKYEDTLKLNGIEKEVIAYRSIIKSGGKGGKCNIDFAKEVFDYISKQDECAVLVFDITGFFDHLNHKILKEKWMDALRVRNLPNEHFCLYQRITRYSYINWNDIDEIEKEKAVFYADKRKFKKQIAPKIMKNKKQYGIPQGTPISGTLANIYLLDFDKSIKEKIQGEGIYRRYSDDLIVVCKSGKAMEVQNFLINELEKVKLEVQPAKAQKVYFKKSNGLYEIFGIESSKRVNFIQYLGFEFDGKDVRIRSSTMSKKARKITWIFKPRIKTFKKRKKCLNKMPVKMRRRCRIYKISKKQNRISYFTKSAKTFISRKIHKQKSRVKHFIGRLRKKYKLKKV